MITVMAGGLCGWSRAALLQLLLGVNLMVMPPIQARTLRFVTLVMRDRVAQGSPELEGHGLAGGGGAGFVLGVRDWRRSWIRRLLACGFGGSGLGAGFGGDVEPQGMGVDELQGVLYQGIGRVNLP